MRRIGYERIGWMLSVVCMGILLGDVRAGQVQSSVDGNAHAKGMSLLRVTFRSQGEVWRAALNTSTDGEDYREAGVGRLGTPDLFKSIMYRDGETTILVPAPGWFGREVSYFDGPGTQWFRWTITFRDQDKGRTDYDQRDYDIEPLLVQQRVEVKPAQRADLDFIERISDPAFIRPLLGDDLSDGHSDAVREKMLDPSEGDLRATAIIGELLKATRSDEPRDAVRERWGKGQENVQNWAEAMWALAQEFPESSYAPYAAYYGACCYYALGVHRAFEMVRAKRVPGSPRDKIVEFEQRPLLIKNDADCAKAGEAFAFAAERADNYLRPRAICMQASLRKWVGAFEEAEALLDKAAAWGGEGGTIHDLVAKMRKGLAKVKERRLNRQQKQDGE